MDVGIPSHVGEGIPRESFPRLPFPAYYGGARVARPSEIGSDKGGIPYGGNSVSREDRAIVADRVLYLPFQGGGSVGKGGKVQIGGASHELIS